MTSPGGTWRDPASAAEAGARSLAGLGLETDLPAPARPLAPDAWAALLGRVRGERLEGLLATAATDGRWPATAAQLAEARDAHRRAMALALTLERLLLGLADDLDGAGVAWRTLKGPAVAHLDHPDPALRSYGDLDVLVAGDDVPTALDLLAARGGRRRYASGSDAFDRRFGKGAACRLPDGAEVDVHRTLALGPYGLALDVDELLAEPAATFEVAGRAVPALPHHLRFVHACYHAALGLDPPRLTALRDVAVLLPDEPTARRAMATARRWRGEAVVARAVALTADVLAWSDGGPLLAWARALEPTDRDRRWLAAYAGPDRSSRARTMRAVEALPSLRSRVAYARSLLPRLRRPAPAGPGRQHRQP